MKNIVALTLGLISYAGAAHAIDWWHQPTVCQLDMTKCYPALGNAGIDTEMWDASAKCRGVKYICADAIGERSGDYLGKTEIATQVKSDFDAGILNTRDDCYGVRRTDNSGTQAEVDGKNVRVYCPNVLSRPDEIVANGEIMFDPAKPTCAELAADGYASILNGKCYGKYYNPTEYYIECGTGLEPTCIVVRNGADPDKISCDTKTGTLDAANDTFNAMYQVSLQQRKKYFNQD